LLAQASREDQLMLRLHRGRPARRRWWWVFFFLAALAGGTPLCAADEARPAKADLPADLALVPPGAPVFLCFQVGPYWNGPEAEVLKKVTQAHPVVVTSIANDLEKQTGLAMSDIEQVVVSFPGEKLIDPLMIITTRKPFDRDKVLGALVPDAKEAMAGATKFYTSDKSILGVRVVNDRTLLLGDAEWVRTFLARPAAAGGGALEETVKAAAGKHLLVVGVVPTILRAEVKNAGPKGEPFVPLMEAKFWELTVDAAEDLRVNVRMTFASEESAKEGQTALKAVGPALAGYLEFCEKEMPPFLKRESAKYPGAKDLSPRLQGTLQNARAGLKGFTSERKGSAVEGSLRIKTDEPVTSFVLLLSMSPRPAKE
jgi:hypothetical protein